MSDFDDQTWKGRRVAPLKSVSVALTNMFFIGLLFVPLAWGRGGDSFHVDMKDADLKALIEWTAIRTGKNMIVDPRVKGVVTVVTNESLAPEELSELLRSALSVHGYTIIEEGAIQKVVPLAEARHHGIPVNPRNGEGSGIALKTYRLQQEPPAEFMSLLKQITSPTAQVSFWEERRLLLVADQKAVIKKVDELVSELDQDAALDPFEVIKLRFTNAADVVKMVDSLSSGRSGRQASCCVADLRTNSVFISGGQAVRSRAREVIAILDREMVIAGNTRVFYLHYAKSQEVLPILQNLSPTLKKQEAGLGEMGADISIQASENTNALVVTAPTKSMSAIEHIIRKLDIKRAQVIVEAVIVEVLESDGLELGIEWRTGTSAIGRDGWYGGTLHRSGSGAGSPTETPALINGLSFGLYNNGSLRGLFTALETNEKVNILSKPNLVALDNEEAKIVVGQNVPFVTGTTVTGATPADNPFQTIKREDVGIALTIKPQINEGDSVTLDIYQEISSIAPASASGAKDIITNTRSVKTRVLVHDGQTLVLGGLMSDEAQYADSKVPFLGRVPIIGGLFTNKNKDKIKSNLMIFIQPKILYDEDDANLITGGRYRLIEKPARRMGYDPYVVD